MKNLDKETINEFYQQWFGAMERGDIEGFLALLDDDFYLKSPNQPAATDKKTLRNALKQFHQSYSETINWNIDELNIFNMSAVARISEEVTLISKETEEVTKMEGVHFSLLNKKANGELCLKSDVGSLNHPPPSSND
jgi:ketosteroid isomerase-like protein